ncbi:MAG: hypothetical protein R3362_09365, partial [Rhodothermales bacterium]|nr:hypothetical protein [Rhodothermales bacterium]
PQPGLGLEFERMLSPQFNRSPDYGTRATTLLVVRADGSARAVERTYGPGGAVGETQAFFFAVPEPGADPSESA